MDTSTLIGIAGITLTVYSIYLVLKRKKYPGKLTLVKENSVGLFNELANNFEEITIEFKNKPIDKNIIYIKGSLINNGESDLNLKDSEVPVGIHLDEELKWIKSKITKSSNNVKCSSEIENNQILKFNCGFLKINEFFQFEALIETNDSKYNSSNIFDKLKSKHRLINTQKITTTSYLNEKQRQKKQSSVKTYAIFLALIIALYCGGAGYKTFFGASTKFEYLYSDELYKITPLTDNTVEVDGIENDIEKIISVEEFHQSYIPQIPNRTYWGHLKKSIWLLVTMLIMYSLSIIWDFIELRKSRQLSDIIEKENN